MLINVIDSIKNRQNPTSFEPSSPDNNENQIKLFKKFLRNNPYHIRRAQIEQYIASFEENILGNTPKKIEKYLKIFFPELTVLFEEIKHGNTETRQPR